MTISIDLTPAEEAQLVAAAQLEGMDPSAFLKKVVSQHLTQTVEMTFAEILAPVHEYSRDHGFTVDSIGEFVDLEPASYRTERRGRKKDGAGE